MPRKSICLSTSNPQEGFFNKHMKVTEYVKETRAELSHVTWPTREQTIRFTTLVIVTSLIVSAILGISDFVFSKLLTLLF